MRIYWDAKSIPELADLPKVERGRVWRACCWKTFKDWQTWLGLLVLGLCVIIGCFISGYVPGNDFLGKVVGAAIGGGVGGFIYGQVVTRQARPHLREYLKGRQI